MKLYGLSSFELLWERIRDTKALMAWNDDTIVLAFRGTASLRNVIADIQARPLHTPPSHMHCILLQPYHGPCSPSSLHTTPATSVASRDSA